jgi:hypothetical protein
MAACHFSLLSLDCQAVPGKSCWYHPIFLLTNLEDTYCGAFSVIPFRFFPSAFRPGSDSAHFSPKWATQAASGDDRKRPKNVFSKKWSDARIIVFAFQRRL